jgi:ribosomal protein S12 methylthiotransferase
LKKKVTVINLGCPKNQVDSEVMAGFLAQKYEYVHNPAEAQIIVVNTCAFIDEAKEESVNELCQMVEYKKDGVCEKVIAAGCLAQRYGKELMQEIPELDMVLGDGNLANILDNIEEAQDKRLLTWKKRQSFLYDEKMPRKRIEPNYYTYIKIAEGCDNCCSYCVIPQIKGSYRSRTKESVIEEVSQLARQGVKEIIVTAQDTTRYGSDIYQSLELVNLLKEIIQINGIEWIRLLYCYPEVFTDELIEFMGKEPKICRYLDLPLQHANDRILAEMNRRYTRQDVESLIGKLRKAMPDIVIRTTFITGLPGEGEEEYTELQDFVRKMKFDKLGVFAYSREENTPAGMREDQVPEEIREDRKDRLLELQAEQSWEIQQKWIGKMIRVIIEEKIDDEKWLGRSEGDAPEIDGQVFVNSSNKELNIGEIIEVVIINADTYDLEGEARC